MKLETIPAGLLAHRSSSLSQPSQPVRPVVRGGDSLFTVAGAALELATLRLPHQIPFSSFLASAIRETGLLRIVMLRPPGKGVNRAAVVIEFIDAALHNYPKSACGRCGKSRKIQSQAPLTFNLPCSDDE